MTSARVGVDVGGTFTDLVRVDADRLSVDKRPSTPEHPEAAVVAGVDLLDPDRILSVAHGTTVATNALLERRGARTAFLATAGFGDILSLGRGERRDLYDLSPRPRARLVEPDLCVEVPERVGPDGAVQRPLSDADARDVARRVASLGVESAAVCLLFSFLHPAHERQLGDALASAAGGPAHVSLSVDVLPEFREYERASTVAANAYVAPIMARYLRRLEAAVAPRRLTVMASHAGTLTPDLAARLPVSTILSGPAAGVTGAVATAKRAGHDRIITLDMGGTSTDVALCDGDVPFAAAFTISGLPINRPAVDVHTVGAGGGSVVRADAGGALRVGPQSAGADPGPVAYGRGGREATVTDAHVVLGRLPADVVLAGGLRLDRRAAVDAMARVGQSLGLSAEEAALGALAVADATMERALRRVSVEQGHAPRDFTLVAFGGAGPLHACALAEAIGAECIVIPVAPGALSAVGLATAAPVATASRSVVRARGTAAEDYVAVFRELDSHVRATLEAVDGIAVDWLADMRYVGQSWELTVPWAPGDDRPPLAGFAAAHRRRYGYDRPGELIEVVTLRTRARAGAPAALPGTPPRTAGLPRGSRVVLGDGRRVEAPVYDRGAVAEEGQIDGPAVIAQTDATTYLAPGWRARVCAFGDLELRRSA